MKDTFYITSAIYYVNALPHIGSAYEIVACDFIARFHRLLGERVWFLTGTDEHSQNVARAAADEGIPPQEWTDRMVPRWKDVFERLLISNDDFIRTSEARHVERVQRFVQTLYDREQIYPGTYEGPYCVSCEEFKQEGELVDGNCPIHGIPVERLREENYFFRLSAYQDALLSLYEEHPEFIEPESRRNEVVAFVKGGLNDLSISRNKALWGVPVPWNAEHVIYVWVDALLNYITAPGYGYGYGSGDGIFDRVWPADVHVIGKDITRFHAVIWPALLMAAGVDVPRQVFAHGFLQVDGEKISKTRGNALHPDELLDRYGVDAYRFYFLREVQWGQDGNFSFESMTARYNADLANGLGNLASRVLAMIASYFDGEVPELEVHDAASARLSETAGEAARLYEERVLAMDLAGALAAAWELVAEANRYLVEVAPWALAKDETRRVDLARSLYAAAETLRILAVLVSPAMPGAADRLWEQLGIGEPLGTQRLPDAARWGGLPAGTKVRRGDALFPRLEA